MKNILFLSHSAELNGAEQWLLQTLERLDKQKFCPYLILPCPGPLEEEAEKLAIEIFHVPMKWWLTEMSRIWKQPLAWLWNIPSIFKVRKIIQAKKIDLVLTNSSVIASGALAARREKIPHIWVIHEVLKGENPIVRFLFGSWVLARFILRLSSKVVVNSRATQKAFGSSERVRLIYNGMEIPEEEYFPADVLRKELSIEEGDIVFGIIGKIYKGKGQRELLQAFASLSSSFPRLKLLVVGGVGNRRYYGSLQKIIRRHSLDKNIIFTGFRKDLNRLLKLVDLIVVASQVESFGRVALQAMASGKPVLAVRSGGLPEIIKNGENGFLVDSSRPEVLAKALGDFLEHREKMRPIIQKAYETVRKRFSLDSQVKEIEELFIECFESGTSAMPGLKSGGS